jgi:phosphate:Na+ symporter
MIFRLVGGIGLFLLGMSLLTDGVKAFAGEALRRALVRFTGTPLKAFGSGALVTALIQSSSATTITLIGFVSAGLLTFPQAVGVVLGASLGTTGTGWLVAVLGLKVSLGLYALPLVGAGAFLKLLARGRWRSLGLALAGFGLIFVGIETLKEGMQDLSGLFDLGALASAGRSGQLVAMILGTALTVVLQSSSAAVAAILTALHAAAVTFEQAAVLVIGAAIGTTVTGVLAVIGGTVPARRTAVAHVLFNLATGLIAIVLLPAFLWGIRLAQERLGLEAGATSLAAFHTAFIATGVLLFLPFVQAFARGVERLLPERDASLIRHLDDTLLQAPGVALEATQRALRETAAEAFVTLRGILDGFASDADDQRRARILQALERTPAFFAKIPLQADAERTPLSRVALMHAIDHLLRLQSRLDPSAGVRRMLVHERLQPAVARTRELLDAAGAGLRGRPEPGWLAAIERGAAELARLRQAERVTFLDHGLTGGRAPSEALEAVDALRWLERVGYHAWRICTYLDPAPEARGKEEREVPGDVVEPAFAGQAPSEAGDRAPASKM